MTAYSIAYRDEIVETQGRLFGRLERLYPQMDGVNFITAYLKSRIRSLVDIADPLPANMRAAELLENFLSEGYQFREGVSIPGIAADWIGQFYAYAQWKAAVSSRELVERLPVERMLIAYPGLHDLSLELATERCKI